MKRLSGFIAGAKSTGDGHAFLLLLTLSSVAAWLLALPVSKVIQQATIDRFHLTTGSFAAWAAQQPIPPMYNLENRYWYSLRPLMHSELTTPPPEGVQSAMLNHFPARMITCASGRLLMLENQRECWFYLKSKYQQTERITAYRLVTQPDSNSLRMELIEEKP